jgi:hypothetical protein
VELPPSAPNTIESDQLLEKQGKAIKKLGIKVAVGCG